jgi:LmbE family N-acetylglucosaminyl deacetylase
VERELSMVSGKQAPPAQRAGVSRYASLAFPSTVDLSRDGEIARFRGRTLVVLSPHFDDACFSLGCFLAAMGRGMLINIFTHGLYLPRREDGDTAPIDQRLVFDIRDGEDQAFGERCGLTRDDLGCEEPVLRGRRPNDLSRVEDDIGQIEKPILAKLEKIAARFADGERGVLFAPMGVGRHANHRATAETVLRHLEKIGVRYDVFFYEDQPYAGHLIDRIRALLRINSRSRKLSVRYVLTPDWAEKSALLALYPTQLRNRPQRWRFWPMAAWPLAPHEAFWSLAASPQTNG